MLGFHDKPTECCGAAVPLPVSVCTAAVVAVLLENVRFAEAVPLACGAKLTVNGRLCPDDRVNGNDNPLKVNSGLVLLAEPMVMAEPLALSVPDNFWLEPTTTLPKFRLAGETLSCPDAAPAPERAMVRLGFDASDDIAMLPLALVLDCGLKLAVKV